VQTGVVMVIYLEEAVDRKRHALGGTLTRAALKEAVIDGALLRLRPKVMTVSTVIAGLLPIMWSTRVGAEVMKPLATPVLGGMVSSLVHVLIVTPVIFFWLRERQLGLHGEPVPDAPRPAVTRRAVLTGLALVLLVLAALGAWQLANRSGGNSPPGGSDAGVIQTVRSGDLEIVLRSQDGSLRQGRNTFFIEFRRPAINTLVDVGAVRASANMPMPGMVMSSGLQVTPTTVAGRYAATAEFGMAGTWQMAIEWNGPAGHGSVNFQGGVQ
jgi:Cu(I)/Ag(I) efflux system membrane protein CusA/SilA